MTWGFINQAGPWVAAATAGAVTFGSIGAGIGLIGGPASPVTVPAGALIGSGIGVGVGLGTYALYGTGQTYFASKVAVAGSEADQAKSVAAQGVAEVNRIAAIQEIAKTNAALAAQIATSSAPPGQPSPNTVANTAANNNKDQATDWVGQVKRVAPYALALVALLFIVYAMKGATSK